jgi:glyoxylase I family protein
VEFHQMKITALLHATFLVADLEKSRAFYEGVLGLSADPARPDLGFPGLWYAVGAHQQIHLMRLPDPEAGLQRPGHGGRDRHLALAVDDLAELAGRLEVQGISYSRSKSGRAALFCRDPDNNALEFVERGL